MGSQSIAVLITHVAQGAEEAPDEMLEAVGMGGGALFVLALLGLLLAVKVGFVGMAVWFDSRWPRASAQMLETYQTRGERCFLTGILDVVVTLIIVGFLLATQVLALLGILLFLCLVALIVVGYAVAYQNLGLRLASAGSAQSSTKTIVLGGIAAESAFFLPVLGQILSLGMLFRGLGAVVLTLLASRRATAKNEPQEPEQAEPAPAKRKTTTRSR